MRRKARRSGFTLLEILLALGIAVVLFAALYAAVDAQLKHSQAARDLVEQSALARNLLNRISNDLASAVSLSDPARFRAQQQAAAAAAATTTDPTMMTDSTTTTDDGTGNTSSIALPLGVVGDESTLHIFVAKLPREAINAKFDEAPAPNGDMRRISYWFIDNADGTGGLAWQEVRPITADNALRNLPPEVEIDTFKIISEEVLGVTFSYFDGANWLALWDSTEPGADGITPIGPPRAVQIEILLPGRGGPDAPPKVYRHVIALVTANGLPLPMDGTTMGTTTTPP